MDGSTDTMWSIQDAISTKLGYEYMPIWIRNRVDLDQESCSELIQMMDLAGEGVAAGVHRERKRYLSEPGVPIPKRTLLRYRQHRLKVEVDPESG